MTTARTLTGIPILLLLKPPVRRFLATSSISLSLRTLQLLPQILPLLQLKRNSGNIYFMRELTLENISCMRIKATLWGDSTSELTRNLEAHELNPQPVVAVVAGVYVKEYLGKASLSSTNATKAYFDLDIPEVLHTRERSSHRTPPFEITVPARVGYNQATQSIADTRKSIFQLLETKWESGYNVLNRKFVVPRLLAFPLRKGGTTWDATTAQLNWLETQGTIGSLDARSK
ncbi:uncharacterized protein LOC113303240 isoform X1 [Papaver somniferum]|uniref:uncharacterized protein LOC113303240 isoform X1 n=1 Tax=Papaver somniferum TaxID=3469 RepID=UPI000E6F5199|nr:uncharacterized protein LOC113303240 isoform X1 [Papaver somniferum]XP_026408053.1 uncharacterized protein LOC113303240 isoform X1 [Papaver somniferum]XP_026408054.1 uncharacterized protein LOC113303240 isoform X1 [Papaver somniferum]